MTGIKALIWNEWRRQQTAVFHCLILLLSIWLIGFLLFTLNIHEKLTAQLAATIFGLPILFGFFLAVSPAREFENHTLPYLQSFPVPPGTIFLVQFIFGLIIYLLLCRFAFVLLGTLVDIGRLPVFQHNRETASLHWLMMVMPFLLYAAMFCFSLAGKQAGNAVAAILILPLLAIGSLPWIAVIFIFTERADANGLWDLLLGDAIFLTFAFVGMSYYLWTRRLSCGRSPAAPLWWATLAVFTVPWLLYAAAWGITRQELHNAFTRADQAGLVLDSRRLPDRRNPSDRDITGKLEEFNTAFTRRQLNLPDKVKTFLQENQLTSPAQPPSRTPSKLTPEENRRAAAYLLNSPESIRLYGFAKEIAHIPNARLHLEYADQESSDRIWQNAFTLETANRMVLARGVACRLEGKVPELLDCWETALSLQDLLAREPYPYLTYCRYLMLRKNLGAVIAAAEFRPELLPFYRRLLADIDTLDFRTKASSVLDLAEQWRTDPGKIIDACCGNSWGLSELSVGQRMVMRVAALPRAQHQLSRMINVPTDFYPLFLAALQTPYFRDLKPEHDRLMMKHHSKWPGQTPRLRNQSMITSYYESRNYLAGDKLALALVIYRTEHGVFPDRLAELVPAILPEIPVSAFTGTPFAYQRIGSGFLINENGPYYLEQRSPYRLDFQPETGNPDGGK